MVYDEECERIVRLCYKNVLPLASRLSSLSPVSSVGVAGVAGGVRACDCGACVLRTVHIFEGAFPESRDLPS